MNASEKPSVLQTRSHYCRSAVGSFISSHCDIKVSMMRVKRQQIENASNHGSSVQTATSTIATVLIESAIVTALAPLSSSFQHTLSSKYLHFVGYDIQGRALLLKNIALASLSRNLSQCQSSKERFAVLIRSMGFFFVFRF